MQEFFMSNEYDDIVVICEEGINVIDRFCDVCDLMITTSDDVEYVKKYSCCESCGMKWAESRAKEWLAGWRPGRESILEHKERSRIIRII